jgi:hypothetical protein
MTARGRTRGERTGAPSAAFALSLSKGAPRSIRPACLSFRPSFDRLRTNGKGSLFRPQRRERSGSVARPQRPVRPELVEGCSAIHPSCVPIFPPSFDRLRTNGKGSLFRPQRRERSGSVARPQSPVRPELVEGRCRDIRPARKPSVHPSTGSGRTEEEGRARSNGPNEKRDMTRAGTQPQGCLIRARRRFLPA